MTWCSPDGAMARSIRTFRWAHLRLRSALKHGRFDVVHAHVARDYPVVAAAALGIRGLTVIFTRHLLYPVRRNPLYKRVDGWIAPTEQILETLAPLKPRRAAVIPNWVDTEKFAFSPHPPHKPVRIGLIGQISPHKGHDDAVEAMRELGNRFRLIIAGEGERSYVSDAEAEIGGIAGRVRWVCCAAGLFPRDRYFDCAVLAGAVRDHHAGGDGLRHSGDCHRPGGCGARDARPCARIRAR